MNWAYTSFPASTEGEETSEDEGETERRRHEDGERRYVKCAEITSGFWKINIRPQRRLFKAIESVHFLFIVYIFLVTNVYLNVLFLWQSVLIIVM